MVFCFKFYDQTYRASMIVAETTVALPVMAYLLAVLVNISVYQIVLPPGGSRHDLNFVPLSC